ncbi:hypothetical protein E1B28_000637 [Marasmius oreades]|uniref:Uncharacterized protein n=1 Tax=Marasmius oreades TaxID=181124 RepID=A0A9P7V1S3_9AGAR|nr:uncharacterized protein E1B28_000637 [Marasmius oreades]KAG7098724.1 hypothetical protein E1B28_000637 [Marasmius oreades]
MSGRTTSSLLAHQRQQQPASTPIPPSLQAKLAAFANRQSPSIDQATSGLHNVNINDHPSSSTPPSHPALRAAASYPPPTSAFSTRPALGAAKPAGLAARRAKAAFNVRDINPNALPTPASGGASAAGLGAGRPQLPPQQEVKRGPLATASFGSSFASFSKIVYAFPPVPENSPLMLFLR